MTTTSGCSSCATSAYATSRRCPTRTGPASRRTSTSGRREFAAAVPECLASATFYPEEGAGAYVGELIAAGTDVFKMHVQVGDFDLVDPLLDDAWGQIADAGTPVVIHASAGTGGQRPHRPGPDAGRSWSGTRR